MFRGSAQAKIDDKGRLKVPTAFQRQIEERWGAEVFVTSILGESALLYPLPVWEDIENRLAALPSTHRAKNKYLERASYFGQEGKLDAQGRIVLPPILRESAGMEGEVVVMAQLDHLEIWNRDRFEKRRVDRPITDEDFESLSEAGI